MSRPLTKPHMMTIRLTDEQKAKLDWLRRTGMWRTYLEETGDEDYKHVGVDLTPFYDNGRLVDPKGARAALTDAMENAAPSATDVVVGAIRIVYALLRNHGPLDEIAEEGDLVRAVTDERMRSRMRETLLDGIHHIEVPAGLSCDEATTHLRGLVRTVRTIKAREARQRKESAQKGESA